MYKSTNMSKKILGLFPFGIYIIITIAIESFAVLGRSDTVWAMSLAFYILWIVFFPVAGLATFLLGSLTVKYT